MSKQTYFDQKWLADGKFDRLHACDTDRTKFKCQLCCKVLNLSNMGFQAVKSHSESTKHRQLAGTKAGSVKTESDIRSFLSCSSASSVASSVECQGSAVAVAPMLPVSAMAEIDSNTQIKHFSALATKPPISPQVDTQIQHKKAVHFATDDMKIRAEIYWVLKMISSHHSYNSASDIADIFRHMFPDSEVAKTFQLGDDKARYMAVFGLAPYFQQLLADKVKKKMYVLLFDEAHNHKSQQKQLDVHIRFWSDTNTVDTRYFTSMFMGHATAADLQAKLDECLAKLKRQNIVQLSMDGPTVNWKLFDLFQSDLEKHTGKTMLNVGSCGLHTVHGGFRDGVSASSWDIDGFLGGAYYLFKDTPARREDYTKLTTSNTFPLKFVAHRWVENVQVIERIIEILPHVRRYVKAIEEKKLKNPKTKSFDTVQSHCCDVLLEVKLHFILSVAKQLQPFLKLYQVDKPMLPFMVADLLKLVKDLLARFVKKEVIDTLINCRSVIKFDFDADVNYSCSVDMGFSADRILKTDAKTKKSEKALLGLKLEARSVLKAICKKLVQKTPIKYPVARSLSCLDPRNMAENPEQCKVMMKRFLEACVETKHVVESDCDDILVQFMDFVHKAPKSELENFNMQHDRIDTFLLDRMGKAYPKAWTVVELALSISHGQATVERGFSINKELIVENQEETSLFARRIIKDHILLVKGVTNVIITREMVLSARSARLKYTNYLAEKKEQEMTKKKEKKRKGQSDALDDMKKKRQRLETDISSMIKTSIAFYDKCESSGNVSLVTQANALRRRAGEKQKELEALDKEIADHCLVMKQ